MFSKLYEKIKIFILENIKFLISLIVLIFVFTYEFPYVVYTPGGLVPLESRISIEGEYDSVGSLNMSYVSMRKGNLPTIIFSFLIPNWDLVKSSEVTYNDESLDELMKLEKLYMTSSVNNATIIAYEKADKELRITKKINNVSYIADFANTDVLLYDIVLKADGIEISDINEMKTVVNTHEVGDIIKITVLRNGKEKECFAYVTEQNGEKKIGIAFLTTCEYETDPEIEVKTKSSESGSSGGLMLSLAIYNKLVEYDITHGLTIVGTGTIDAMGNVGKIDGIKYKLLGASKKTDIFLCPEENYEEAIKVKNEYNLEMEIKMVKTFDEAVEYLSNL